MSFMRSLIIGLSMVLAFVVSESTLARTDRSLAFQRPAICGLVFKTYEEALRRCSGYGINRRFDSRWNFIGFGCACDEVDEPYFPKTPNTDFGNDPIPF